MSSEAAGLFAPAADVRLSDASVAGGPKVRRTKLYKYDAVASQLFDHHGLSINKSLSTKELWAAAARGSVKAAFHTELAADDSTGGFYRIGVGVSQSAGTMLTAIQQLRDTDVAMLLNEKWLKVAMVEAADLEPHLRVLNAGKGSEGQAEESSFSNLKKRRISCAQSSSCGQTSAEAVKAASEAVHKWLTSKTSPLRGDFEDPWGRGYFLRWTRGRENYARMG